MSQDEKQGPLNDEPNWLILSRKLDREYEQSRPQPLNLSMEEIESMIRARYPTDKKRLNMHYERMVNNSGSNVKVDEESAHMMD